MSTSKLFVWSIFTFCQFAVVKSFCRLSLRDCDSLFESECRVYRKYIFSNVVWNHANEYISEDIDGDDEFTNSEVFYRDLQKAKKKLGSDIPPNQLRDSAISSEVEFLKAMKESEKEFQQAKEQQKDGSISASEFFLGKILEEEERQEKEYEDGLDEERIETSFE